MEDGWKPNEKIDNDKCCDYYLIKKNEYLTISWTKSTTEIIIYKNKKLNNKKIYTI